MIPQTFCCARSQTLLTLLRMSKTKACHCCSGSGTELDHEAVGAEMRALRVAKGKSLRQVGKKMKLCAPYICDLERGHRTWRPDLIAQFKKALA